jgi:hypothetical protein
MGTYYAINTTDSLYHHGVKGMKWGRRRYQNEDGSLTPLGEARYDKLHNRLYNEYIKSAQIKQKLENEKNSTSYRVAQAKYGQKKDELQAESDRLKAKNQKTRYKMEMLGKTPGFFAKRNLRKEYRVNKKLSKVENKIKNATKLASDLSIQSARSDARVQSAQRKFQKYINNYGINEEQYYKDRKKIGSAKWILRYEKEKKAGYKNPGHINIPTQYSRDELKSNKALASVVRVANKTGSAVEVQRDSKGRITNVKTAESHNGNYYDYEKRKHLRR